MDAATRIFERPAYVKHSDRVRQGVRGTWVLFDDLASKIREELEVKQGYPEQIVRLLITWLESFARDVGGMVWIDQKQALYMLENWLLALEHDDPELLLQPRGLRVDRIVDIQEFVESKEFMGQKGFVRQPIMEHLWNIFHGSHSDSLIEIVLGGAIGIGKNYMADMGMAYIIYRLSCYHNPQIDFGLAPGSSIVFIAQSEKMALARKVIFDQFAGRIKQSPYFTKQFPFDPNFTSELRFPNNIIYLPVSGSTTAALGMNAMGGVLDELNFMARVRKSKYAEYTGEEEFDQAEKLYTTIIRRMKSRFMDHGRLPGRLFLISSANYPGDFIDRKIKEAEQEDPKAKTIYVMKMAQWESLPPDRFCGQTFFVEVGDEKRQSRILSSKNEAVDPGSVIEVPIEYRSDFERDLEGAIRDLAGIPVGGRNPFFRVRENIDEATKRHHEVYGDNQLFLTDMIDLSRVDDLRNLLNPEFFTLLKRYQQQNPDAPPAIYAVHIDLGLTKDFCGIALSRLVGFDRRGMLAQVQAEAALGPAEQTDEPPAPKPMAKRKASARAREKQRHSLVAPVVSVDGVLGVIPPKYEEIDVLRVVELLKLISQMGRSVGMLIGWASADRFQSAAMLQALRKLGASTDVVSVDKTPDPYFELREALSSHRVWLPDHRLLRKELVELEYDAERNKIDHPPNGSKDLADAVAGSVYTILTRKVAYSPDVAATLRRRVDATLERQKTEARKHRRAGRRPRTVFQR